MKIACCYASRLRQWPKFQWVQDALAGLGHAVTHVETQEQLWEADETCELILFEQRGAAFGHKQILNVEKSGKAVWVQWWFDLIQREPELRFEDQHLIRTYGELMRKMDVVLTKERDCEGMYAAHGINMQYLDQGAYPETPACEHPEAPEFDVVVFGSYQIRGLTYEDRFRDVKALLDAGLTVLWAGYTGPAIPGLTRMPRVHVLELSSLMSRGAVTLCTDLRQDVAGYWSDRFWLAMGAGACVVKRHTDGQPELPYCTYNESAGLVNAVQQLRRDYSRRVELGKQARQESLKHHTYQERLRGYVESATRPIMQELQRPASIAG